MHVLAVQSFCSVRAFCFVTIIGLGVVPANGISIGIDFDGKPHHIFETHGYDEDDNYETTIAQNARAQPACPSEDPAFGRILDDTRKAAGMEGTENRALNQLFKTTPGKCRSSHQIWLETCMPTKASNNIEPPGRWPQQQYHRRYKGLGSHYAFK